MDYYTELDYSTIVMEANTGAAISEKQISGMEMSPVFWEVV